MFTKILIANRGEIAVRVARSCRALGIESVAVHSTADAGSMHIRVADTAIDLGDGPASSNYLNIPKIIAAADRIRRPGHSPRLRFPLGEPGIRGRRCRRRHRRSSDPRRTP